MVESQTSNGVLLKLWVNSAPYLWYVSAPKYRTHYNPYGQGWSCLMTNIADAWGT